MRKTLETFAFRLNDTRNKKLYEHTTDFQTPKF